MHIPPCTFNSKLFIIQCKLYASICHTGEVGLGNGDKCLSVFIRDTFSHAFSVHWWLKEGWRKGVDCAHNSLEQDNELGRPRWPPALRMQCRGLEKGDCSKGWPSVSPENSASSCSLQSPHSLWPHHPWRSFWKLSPWRGCAERRHRCALPPALPREGLRDLIWMKMKTNFFHMFSQGTLLRALWL